jgi:hypothetical protein
MAKVHYMPARRSEADTSFRNLDAEEAARDTLPEHKRATQPPRASDAHSIEAALRRAVEASEPTSRPAHERLSEVRLSAPSSIEEAVLRVVEELDAFMPIEPHRPLPKA